MTTQLLLAYFLAAGLAAAPSGPKNVILMIGDGMGYNQVQAGSLYTYGAYDGQPYWRYYVDPISTQSLDNPNAYEPDKAWASFGYFDKLPTDSAAAATAMSTGVKVQNGLIQMTEDGQRLDGLVDTAEAMGKATGVLSTVFFSHATPAAFVAHDASRKNVAEIAQEMILESPVDLILAPGHPWFDNDGKQVGGLEPDVYASTESYDYVGGEALFRQLREGTAGGDADADGDPDAWTLVDQTQAIQDLAQGATPARLLGLVPVHATLRSDRGGDVAAPPYAAPINDSLPGMADMMRAALNVLDNDPEGFFLMAEGGAIDWAAHGNQMGRLIEEQVDFDEAIGATMAWVEQNSSWEDTLLIITADHETGYLWGPG
ncbi:MAG: alkaline phosphatase, partial [Candidatus Hydrogenedentes bacterium]|nr:alkaline phosphatase [Candidatus Hydrogenedentota bacterium]